LDQKKRKSSPEPGGSRRKDSPIKRGRIKKKRKRSNTPRKTEGKKKGKEALAALKRRGTPGSMSKVWSGPKEVKQKEKFSLPELEIEEGEAYPEEKGKVLTSSRGARYQRIRGRKKLRLLRRSKHLNLSIGALGGNVVISPEKLFG